MGLKIISQFDTTFSLTPESQQALFALLEAADFCRQVCAQTGWQQARFTELLFQPVPYSEHTPKGMPPEFEQYHGNPGEYALINVPPPFMFQAKIFRPSRLCGVYQKISSDC